MPFLDSAQQAFPWQSGSDTSRDAAVAAQGFGPRQREQYWDWLERRGELGGTDAEAAAALGFPRSSICPRRNELKARILDTGLRRGGCTVWRAL